MEGFLEKRGPRVSPHRTTPENLPSLSQTNQMGTEHLLSIISAFVSQMFFLYLNVFVEQKLKGNSLSKLRSQFKN